MKRVWLIVFASIIVLILVIVLAFKFSPWPSALIIRYAFNKESAKVNEALGKHVLPGVTAVLDQQYDIRNKDARLDIYYPSATTTKLPVIVWVHGGGWISGSKEHIANYCKILAAHNYVTVSIDYSIAPEKNYPLPVLQSNTALAYLLNNAEKLHIDTGNFILAGDSGGAHIIAQVANAITDQGYAGLLGVTPSLKREQLSGLLLYCGPYDAHHVNLDGAFGKFLKTVLWSYSGKRDFLTDPAFQTASVINYVNANFPPTFISAGNGDPLLVHSQSLAGKLLAMNVQVDTLFFKPDYSPELPHEYQFNLDSDAGRIALDSSLAFLKRITALH